MIAVLGLLILILIIVVVLGGTRLKPIPLSVVASTHPAQDATRAAQRLAGSLKFQTVSYEDPGRFPGPLFLELHDYLREQFPGVHSTLTREVVEEYSLLYTWAGERPELEPILLMGHMDVVPVEPGTEGDWVHPPFAGVVDDGFVWGRGAMDIKVSVVGLLEAVERLLSEGFRPQRTVLLAFGHDEEVGGKGSARIASILRSRGVSLHMVLDEGMAITEGLIPGVEAPAALVGLAEKGNVSIELTVETDGGHSSMPPRQTAAAVLAGAVQRVQRSPMPSRLDGPVRGMFLALAPRMGFLRRVLFGNLWLFGGLVRRALARSPTTDALIRTTAAVTWLQSGVKENVVPTQARAVVNYRIAPGDSVESVLAHATTAVGDTSIGVGVMDSSREPTPVSPTDSGAYATLTSTIRELFPEVVVAPGLVLGGTDSRHYVGLTDNIYRFLPLWVRPGDLQRIHGTNERLSVVNYGQIVGFYSRLIQNCSPS